MKATILILALTFPVIAQTYSGSFLNLYTPISGTGQGDFEFSMNHRFFGAALKDEPLDTFFGLDNGANVRFGMRYYARDDFYLSASHARLGNNNSVNAGWSIDPAPSMEFGVECGYASIKPSSSEDREGGIMFTGSFSLSTLQGRLKPVFNYAYDGNREESGPGLGIEFQAAERLALFGEYYPAADDGAEEDCFGFGARYNTWGHQFLFGLTNSYGIGIYEQLAGSNTQDLSFALSIRRLF